MRPDGKSLESSGFRLNRAIARDQSVKAPIPDCSTPKNAPKTSITPNSVIVLCAIVALVATLAVLESHIRSMDHAHAVGVEMRGHSPKEVFAVEDLDYRTPFRTAVNVLNSNLVDSGEKNSSALLKNFRFQSPARLDPGTASSTPSPMLLLFIEPMYIGSRSPSLFEALRCASIAP
jgi:hypothetical protein